MPENGIPYPVTDQVRRIGADGHRGRRPVLTGILIPQVDSFGGWVTNRVIMPGSQAIFTAVMRPGASQPCFGDKTAKLGLGNDVAPRCRRPLARFEVDDIFTSVGGKTAQSIIKEQVRGAFGAFFGLSSYDRLSSWDHVRQAHGLIVQFLQLACEGPSIFIQNNTRSRFQQGAFGFTNLVFP